MKNRLPEISIIIPVYNVEPYLRQCLDSIVNQTFQNIEILAINDGSTDASYAILQEYAANDSRFVIRTQPNSGLAATRNAGLALATGKYVYCLDSDDFIDLDSLEILYQTAESFQLDFIRFERKLIFETEELRRRFAPTLKIPEDPNIYGELMTGGELFARMFKRDEFSPSLCIHFIRRDFITNFAFNSGILHEDVPFCVKMYLSAKRAKYLPHTFFSRRYRANSIMTKERDAKNVIGYFVGYCEILRFASKIPLSPEVKEGLIHYLSYRINSIFGIYAGLPQEARKQAQWNSYQQEEVFFEISMRPLVRRFEKTVGDLRKKLHTREQQIDALKKKSVIPSKPQQPPINIAELELAAIRASLSFRIGHMITWLPRKLRGGWRCLQENGLSYTLTHCFKKVKKAIKREKGA